MVEDHCSAVSGYLCVGMGLTSEFGKLSDDGNFCDVFFCGISARADCGARIAHFTDACPDNRKGQEALASRHMRFNFSRLMGKTVERREKYVRLLIVGLCGVLLPAKPASVVVLYLS